jgi:acyl carrier protein
MKIKTLVRTYISDNFLFGSEVQFSDSASLLESGIIDSTGAMELVAFLETQFDIMIEDRDLTPENLDSVSAISSFVTKSLGEAQKQPGAPLAATP